MRLNALTVPKMDLYKYNPQKVPPIVQVRDMEDSAFEDFVGEWLYASKQSEYSRIQLVGGAGDKGRDAIATCSNGKVDYYQCKHYNHALTPSEFTVELGKLCYYTWLKDYPIPRTYYIVASNDIGPTLKDYLDHPEQLKKEVLNHWEDRCKNKISAEDIPLDRALKQYIESFDFSIVQHYPIQRVINEHLPTIYGSLRFGAPSVERPTPIEVPDELEEHEQRYIAALLTIYSHEEHTPICTLEDLSKFEQWYSHLERQRRDYFAAEAIRRAVRDIFTDNDEFQVFKDEVYDGIIDIYEDDFDTGLKRLRKVLMQSTSISIQKSLLSNKLNWIGTSEKKGACHMLVNDGRLRGWEDEK